jgi:hypothetical protein
VGLVTGSATAAPVAMKVGNNSNQAGVTIFVGNQPFFLTRDLAKSRPIWHELLFQQLFEPD